ncbi:MAG TPA: CorA family divalent cation transporter, partial [Candidatus Limnocylindrales bacterium]|nr:CorA family divalent cation transporter [Candidatus Limnocylindrales bacterium]
LHPVTIRAVLYDAKADDRTIDLDRDELRITKDRLLWIDLDDREPGDLRRAAKAVGLESEGLDRLSREDRRATILRLPDRVVLTLGAVEPEDAEARRREIDIVIGVNHVITVHEGGLTAVDTFRGEIHHEGELGRLDAASFTAGLIDAICSSFFLQIEAIERDIDELDVLAVKASGSRGYLDAVVILRRRIARLRRTLAPNREALSPLQRPDFELRSDLGQVWPGTIQRVERAIDGVENARELLVGSFDLYLGRSSQRTNDVMKVLTLVSAIALPGIVLAGVMGMNFKLPFFDDPANFWVVVGTMVLFAGAILGVARWRDWI